MPGLLYPKTIRANRSDSLPATTLRSRKWNYISGMVIAWHDETPRSMCESQAHEDPRLSSVSTLPIFFHFQRPLGESLRLGSGSALCTVNTQLEAINCSAMMINALNFQYAPIWMWMEVPVPVIHRINHGLRDICLFSCYLQVISCTVFVCARVFLSTSCICSSKLPWFLFSFSSSFGLGWPLMTRLRLLPLGYELLTVAACGWSDIWWFSRSDQRVRATLQWLH